MNEEIAHSEGAFKTNQQTLSCPVANHFDLRHSQYISGAYNLQKFHLYWVYKQNYLSFECAHCYLIACLVWSITAENFVKSFNFINIIYNFQGPM